MESRRRDGDDGGRARTKNQFWERSASDEKLTSVSNARHFKTTARPRAMSGGLFGNGASRGGDASAAFSSMSLNDQVRVRVAAAPPLPPLARLGLSLIHI